MKIVLFIDKLCNGGAERQSSILANLLIEKSFDVELTTYSPLPDEYPLNKLVRRVSLYSSNTIRRHINIIKYFRSTDADVIISFMIGNTNHIVRSLFLKRKKFILIAGERNITTSENWEKEKVAMAKSYKIADYIVANSFTQADNLMKMFPQWKNRIKAITNYTDVEHILPCFPKCNEIIKIGVFARYSQQKNCLSFAKAVKRAKSIGNRTFRVDWYGNNSFGPDNLYEELIGYIRHNDLSDVFYLHNSVEIDEVMPDIDIICLPSLWEGFSNSVAEGICYGKPMLVSDVSDNHVMVKDGDNGFLFDPTDINEMEDALIKILNCSNEELCLMGKSSRRIAEQLFDSHCFINNYIQLFK